LGSGPAFFSSVLACGTIQTRLVQSACGSTHHMQCPSDSHRSKGAKDGAAQNAAAASNSSQGTPLSHLTLLSRGSMYEAWQLGCRCVSAGAVVHQALLAGVVTRFLRRGLVQADQTLSLMVAGLIKPQCSAKSMLARARLAGTSRAPVHLPCSDL
jgi:hypothetical protein